MDLSIIGLDVEDGDAGVTVGGGEEDMRPLDTGYGAEGTALL